MAEEEQVVDETLDEGRNLDGSEQTPSMAPEKKRKIVMIAMIATTAISLLGGGTAVVIVLTQGVGGGAPEVVEIDTTALRDPGPEDLPIYHEFPEQTVDIKTKGRRTRFVRIRMVAELYFPENLARLQAMEPKILDGMQTYLRAHTAKELSGRKGTKAIRAAFNAITIEAMGKAHKVNAILFKEILIQ